MKTKYLILILIAVPLFYIGIFSWAFWILLRDTHNATLAAIIGALAGALGAILTAALTSLVAIWSRQLESDRQLKELVSSHSLELTRMDYDLRQKALTHSGEIQDFLAPVKVYRELCKALLGLHKQGIWGPEVEKLGLLNVFRFDPIAAERRQAKQNDLILVEEFLGVPLDIFVRLLHGGQTYNNEERRDLANTVSDWIDKNAPKLPKVEWALRAIAKSAGSMITDDGLHMYQSPDGFKKATEYVSEVKKYASMLRKELGRDV